MIITHSKPVSLYLLVLVLVFQSITALICGAALMLDPSGALLQLPPIVLQTAVFNNFFIPGFFLFTCLGVLPLVAVYALLTKNKSQVLKRVNIYNDYQVGWMLSLFSGFGTLIWISAQLYFTETYHFLQTVYAIVGLTILVLTLLPATMRYCRTND